MIINGEEVELVTSFDQLRAGMIVYVKNCDECGRPWCRFMLGNFSPPHLQVDGEDGYDALPPCSDTASVVGRYTVETQTLYRVVDPKLSATTARKREAVRP